MEFKVTKEDFISKWTEALRSGKYDKDTGALKTRKGYCCLGVLCEVAGLSADYDEGQFRFMNEGGTLPQALAKHIGLTTDGSFRTSVEYTASDEDEEVYLDTLAEVNDDSNLSFAQIADLIEEKHKKGDFRIY